MNKVGESPTTMQGYQVFDESQFPDPDHVQIEVDQEKGRAHVVNLRRDGNKTYEDGSNTWLHTACSQPNTKLLDGFIFYGGKNLDLEVKNREDQTPLMRAVSQGRLNVVNRLIAANANVNGCSAKGWSALHIAAMKNDITIARILLENGAQITEGEADYSFRCTPIHQAAKQGSIEFIQLLMQYGDSPHNLSANNTNALFNAFLYNSFEVCRYLLMELKVDPSLLTKKGDTLLHYSVMRSLIQDENEIKGFKDPEFEKTKLLIDFGLNPNLLNGENETVLFVALGGVGAGSIYVRYQIIVLLLESGADPNIKCGKDNKSSFCEFGRVCDRFDSSQRVELTKLFLAKGAKIDTNVRKSFEGNYCSDVKKIIEDNDDSCVIL